MSSEPTPTCSEHRRQIAELDRRMTKMEAVIGSTADEGLRDIMSKMGATIEQVLLAVQALQLAQARATGAIDGATWVGRGLWAVLGAAITAGVLTLIKAP